MLLIGLRLWIKTINVHSSIWRHSFWPRPTSSIIIHVSLLYIYSTYVYMYIHICIYYAYIYNVITYIYIHIHMLFYIYVYIYTHIYIYRERENHIWRVLTPPHRRRAPPPAMWDPPASSPTSVGAWPPLLKTGTGAGGSPVPRLTSKINENKPYLLPSGELT